ncbi:protein starmaker-like [Capsicum annuum]
MKGFQQVKRKKSSRKNKGVSINELDPFKVQEKKVAIVTGKGKQKVDRYNSEQTHEQQAISEQKRVQAENKQSRTNQIASTSTALQHVKKSIDTQKKNKQNSSQQHNQQIGKDKGEGKNKKDTDSISSEQERIDNENYSSDQDEDNISEHTGKDLTTEEEGNDGSSTDDCESIEDKNIDSDDEAEKLIQTVTNSNIEEEIEKTFQNVATRTNLSPRSKHTRRSRNNRGRRGGYNSQSVVTRSQAKNNNLSE